MTYLGAGVGLIASGGTGAPFIASLLAGIGASAGVGNSLGKEICKPPIIKPEV